MNDSNLKEMSLIDHITELRKRLLWSFLYIIIIFVICFYFADELFSFLANIALVFTFSRARGEPLL